MEKLILKYTKIYSYAGRWSVKICGKNTFVETYSFYLWPPHMWPFPASPEIDFSIPWGASTPG